MTNKNSQTQSKAIVNLHSRTLTLNLSHSDFLTFYALLADANNRKPNIHDFFDMLLHNIMVDVYQLFHKEGAEEKSGYTIQLAPKECMAFWLYWTDHPFASTTLAGKMLDQVNNIILIMFTNSGSTECYL
ncbi:MAG: hypothetical protein ACM3VS_02985 [Candidatus Dadabacteria bacterium]